MVDKRITKVDSISKLDEIATENFLTLAAMKRFYSLTWPPEEETISVSAKLMHYLLQFSASRVTLDEKFYLSKYPDVAEAISQGRFNNVQHHYEYFGFFEGRQPFKIVVDEDYYLKHNPDIMESICNGYEKSAQSHFERYGWKEGRLPWEKFDLFKVNF